MKSKAMIDFLNRLAPHGYSENQVHCAWCGEDVDLLGWRDALSAKEFKISKLCQSCQDKTFGVKNV